MHLDIHIQNKIPVDLSQICLIQQHICNSTSFFVGAETLVFILTISLVSTATNHQLPFFIQCVNKQHHSYTACNADCFV